MAKETLPKSLPHVWEQRHGTVRFAGLSNSLRSHGTAIAVLLERLLEKDPAQHISHFTGIVLNGNISYLYFQHLKRASGGSLVFIIPSRLYNSGPLLTNC
jgi:hypothetical protein